MPTIAVLSRIRTKQDPARAAAGFNEGVRFRRLLERQRFRDHGLHFAAADDREYILELIARHARDGKHRLVLEKKLRRIERDEVASELPDQHPASRGAEAAAHRLEEHGADVIDEHIDAAPIREALHLRREVLP